MSILSELMPTYDTTRIEWRVIDARIADVYAAAVTTDFLDAVRQHPAVRVLFALRSAAERVVGAIRGRAFEEPPAPESLRLQDLSVRGEWVRLGADRPSEFAFGAIGRFWAGETKWIEIDGGAFNAFTLPGYAKIGCHFALTSLSDGRTLLSYQARTYATDDVARRAFQRYWWVVSPFVGVVMRATLAEVARKATPAVAARRHDARDGIAAVQHPRTH